MKVVLLSGSPNKNGNTMAALQKCAEAIEEKGVEAKILSLAGKSIVGCKNCGGCANGGNCIIDDGLNEIIDEIKDAEGYIIGAPVYYGTARGDLMSAVQRIARIAGRNGSWLKGKVGGPIAVARRGGATATIQEMLMMYLICGMTVPGSTYWNILFGGAPGAVLNDEEGINTVKNFGENVAQLIIKIHQ